MTNFTKGELEVMQILWEHGEMKPAEIQDLFPRSIKNSALRSFLSILLKKGDVTRHRVGKAYYYKAKAKKDPAFKSMLNEMVNTFFSGSREALLCRLIKSENLTAEELIELKRMADDQDDDSEGGWEQS